jgi:hypothetical protein
LEEEKRQLEQQQAEAKRQAEQTIKENAELRKKVEAAERELARQRAENALPKTDPVAEQQTRKLEKANAAMKREADLAKAAQRKAEQRLADEQNNNIAEPETLPTAAAEPAAPAKSGGVEAIAAGEFHTCALTTAGGGKCWGSNKYGQLGDNSTTERHTPVNVIGFPSGTGFATPSLTFLQCLS